MPPDMRGISRTTAFRKTKFVPGLSTPSPLEMICIHGGNSRKSVFPGRFHSTKYEQKSPLRECPTIDSESCSLRGTVNLSDNYECQRKQSAGDCPRFTGTKRRRIGTVPCAEDYPVELSDTLTAPCAGLSAIWTIVRQSPYAAFFGRGIRCYAKHIRNIRNARSNGTVAERDPVCRTSFVRSLSTRSFNVSSGTFHKYDAVRPSIRFKMSVTEIS